MKDKKIVTHIPMNEIWNKNVTIEAKRKRYLTLNDIKSILSNNNAIQFIVANIGNELDWISLDECFNFWKSEIKPHLVSNPDEEFFLEDFPNEYSYVASEWFWELQTPVVLLEMHH